MSYNPNGVDPEADDQYFKWLEDWAARHSDGCTGVKDWYVHCCWAHDFGYQTGFDPYQWFMGNPQVQGITESNRKLRECIQAESKLGRFSPISWTRWMGVSLFGRFFYHPKGVK